MGCHVTGKKTLHRKGVITALCVVVSLMLLSTEWWPPHGASASYEAATSGTDAARGQPQDPAPGWSPIAVWGKIRFTWFTSCFYTGYYLDADGGSFYWLQPDALVEPYLGSFVLVRGMMSRDPDGCAFIQVSTITLATPPVRRLFVPVVLQR